MNSASARAGTRRRATAQGSRRGGLTWPLLVTKPLVVGAACLLTYLWIDGQELGFTERGLLNASRLRRLTLEHLDVALSATLIVVATAIPLGIVLTRPGWRSLIVLATIGANIAQATTAFGAMVLIFLQLIESPGSTPGGAGRTAAILGMAAYAFLPVLRGTLTGLDQVDKQTLKAARGMGMTGWQVLRRVELPLAVPIMLAGVRTSLVLTVATTTIAALVGAGGLGVLIINGYESDRTTIIVAGFVATAGIAVLADWAGAVVERFLRPRGL
ncbi:MAG: ABC transporter permease subunit [Propionibacteriales bacterium]|nr:ABC transporter permease subunit [Propionibacteriales bacterium]